MITVSSSKTINSFNGFFGFEDGRHIATGLGFGAVKGLPLLDELMHDYEELEFVKEDVQEKGETLP